MNIQLLLSGMQSQGSPSATKQSLSSPLESSGMFRQALSQAANAPVGSNTAFDASADPVATVAQQLQDLGFDISEDDLALLLGQLSQVGNEAPDLPLTLDASTDAALTPLEEIAERLKLVAAFSGESEMQRATAASPTLESLAQQLAISEEEVADLISALDQLIDPAEGEFASISSALSALLPPQQGGDHKQIAIASAAPAESFRHAPSTSTLPPNASQALQPNIQEALITPASLTLPDSREPALEDLMSLRPSPLTATLPPSAQTGQNSTALSPFISTPVTSPAWPSQLGQQLIQFTQRGGEQQVQMQLHPAELGPLSITLKVTEQGTQAHFLSAHAQVRQIIEHAIPQLRETLAEQGISLGDTSVGEHQNPQEQAFARQGKGSGSGAQDSVTGSDSTGVLPAGEGVPQVTDGRVDLYA